MSGLTGLFPDSEQAAELQAAGWSLACTTGKMACIRKDESGRMLPWDEALAELRSEQAEARKAKR